MKEVIVRATKMALEVGSAFFNMNGSVTDSKPNLVSLKIPSLLIPKHILVSGMVEDYLNKNLELVNTISNSYIGIVLVETTENDWSWEIKLYVEAHDVKF